jgi:hypothetical protein
MGQAGMATCRGCGHGFWLSTGGGFEAQIVFCEACGHGESVIHNQKPLGDGDPSARVGNCSRCPGSLQLDARPRCPRCRSEDPERGPMDMLWD